MRELVFHLALDDVKLHVIDSLFESSLEKSNIPLWIGYYHNTITIVKMCQYSFIWEMIKV